MHVIRFGEAFLGIAKNVVIILLQVVGTVLVNEIGLGLHRFFGIEVRGQRLVLHVDQLERALGNFFVDGCDARHVVANVANLLDRQRRLVVADRQDSVLVRSVFTGNDRNHAVERSGPRGVNALDARVRVRRMQDLAHQHAGKAEVVGVFAGAGRLAGSVHHGDRFANN